MLYDSLFYGLSPRNAMIFKPFSFEEVPLFYFKRLEQQSERDKTKLEGVREKREREENRGGQEENELGPRVCVLPLFFCPASE